MSKKKATAINLPLSRTAKIMTSAVGVESVNQDIVALATKATEIFLMDFARRAYDQASCKDEFASNELLYDDIQRLVHADTRYDFLIDTVPKRIKYADALRLVEEKRKDDELLKEEMRQIMIEKEAEAKKNKAAKEASKQHKENVNNQKDLKPPSIEQANYEQQQSHDQSRDHDVHDAHDVSASEDG